MIVAYGIEREKKRIAFNEQSGFSAKRMPGIVSAWMYDSLELKIIFWGSCPNVK
jgi:hypothetical protein